MNKIYLNIKVKEVMNASSKAVNDCNEILSSCGYRSIDINIINNGNGLRRKIINSLEFFKLLKIKKNSILLLAHPIYINKNYMSFLKLFKILKNFKIVFLIHDLESLRKMFPDAINDFRILDASMYSLADGIIAHNNRMKNYITEQGVDACKIICLEIFDYLSEEIKNEYKYASTINIAGNLDANKASYLKQLKYLNKKIDINLYGVNFEESIFESASIRYKGAFHPDEVPHQFNCGFGLVWDGTSKDTCTGPTGEYLKYNNPHKLSLYLAAGMPVAIWSDAAEASFVQDNNLGILINSLDELAVKFDQINERNYDDMLKSIKPISERLRSGFYLEKAIKEIESNLMG